MRAARTPGQLGLWAPPDRVELQARAQPRTGNQLGALGFQDWLAHWRTADTHHVYLASDHSHAIAVPKDAVCRLRDRAPTP